MPYFEHDKTTLVGLARIHSDRDGWATISLRFGYLKPDGSTYDNAYGTDPLDSLEVSNMVGADGTAYGWYLRFDSLYRQTLSDLKPKYELLSSLQRKLDRWEKEWGEPTTFGAFAHRVAKALSVTRYIKLSEGTNSNGYWIDTDTQYLAYYLDRAVQIAVDERQPKAEAAHA